MDDLHALAVNVARRILEDKEEDPAAVALARALLEEAQRTVLPLPPARLPAKSAAPTA
jgi:hypothetical protein